MAVEMSDAAQAAKAAPIGPPMTVTHLKLYILVDTLWSSIDNTSWVVVDESRW